MELLFTPQVMVIGQVILISPVILGLVIAALSGVDKVAYETAIAIGASQFQATTIVIREARYAIYSALILGFGRAISEVGLALMVGGNIRGYTRVMTTAISLETSKGDIVLSVALGIILISIALIINFSLSRLQQRWR
jgi:tungstate transport system permease protein